MTNITVAVPDELAETARAQGVLDPQRLTTLMCEVLVRETEINGSAGNAAEVPSDGRPLFKDLMRFAGSIPGLPEDLAENHDHYAPTPDDCRSLQEALLSLAGAAGPGLPADFADNHDHYIHGAPKK